MKSYNQKLNYGLTTSPFLIVHDKTEGIMPAYVLKTHITKKGDRSRQKTKTNARSFLFHY